MADERTERIGAAIKRHLGPTTLPEWRAEAKRLRAENDDLAARVAALEHVADTAREMVLLPSTDEVIGILRDDWQEPRSLKAKERLRAALAGLDGAGE